MVSSLLLTTIGLIDIVQFSMLIDIDITPCHHTRTRISGGVLWNANGPAARSR